MRSAWGRQWRLTDNELADPSGLLLGPDDISGRVSSFEARLLKAYTMGISSLLLVLQAITCRLCIRQQSLVSKIRLSSNGIRSNPTITSSSKAGPSLSKRLAQSAIYQLCLVHGVLKRRYYQNVEDRWVRFLRHMKDENDCSRGEGLLVQE